MEKITNIEIKNFKSIRHAEIKDCRRINVFIGYPNVGKSNILEALGLYSYIQFDKKEKFLLKDICRFNHFSDLNFDKDTKNEVHIGINKIYELYLKKNDDKSLIELGIFSSNKNGRVVFNTIIDESFQKQFFDLNPDQDIPDIKYYLFDKDAKSNLEKSSSLSIPTGDNLLSILHGDSDLRKDYTELLQDYQLRLNISESEIGIAKELSDGTYISFQNNMVSETFRRLFFYKATIKTNQNSVLLFEEPEAQMFPPYIKKLTTDILMDQNYNQYFIATHSPYVLDELILEAGEDLAVYLVDYKNGETIIQHLSNEDLIEIRQYGVDLFFNIESYLKHGQVHHS